MANDFIYVWSDSSYDYSRWLRVVPIEGDSFRVDLTDLCMPGRISALQDVIVPRTALESVLSNGALQISTGTGFFLMRQLGDVIALEFRDTDDETVCKARVRIADVREKIPTPQPACAI